MHLQWLFPCGSDGKESACSVGDMGVIPGSGRSPGKENGYPLQYFCLENSMDGGAWQATVRGVAKSQRIPWVNNSTTFTTIISRGLLPPYISLGMAMWALSAPHKWRVERKAKPHGLPGDPQASHCFSFNITVILLYNLWTIFKLCHKFLVRFFFFFFLVRVGDDGFYLISIHGNKLKHKKKLLNM